MITINVNGEGRGYSQAPIDSFCSRDFTITFLVFLFKAHFNIEMTNNVSIPAVANLMFGTCRGRSGPGWRCRGRGGAAVAHAEPGSGRALRRGSGLTTPGAGTLCNSKVL